MTWLILGLGAFIAFVNGANDVGKGVATLVDSGVTSYRRALLWGSAWTMAGAMAASALGGALLATFGRGLLSESAAPTLSSALAVLIGAALWVSLATRKGLPVSTTHAIVGALAGVGTLAYGVAGLRWGVIAGKIIVPLLVGPAMSFLLSAFLARLEGGLGERKAVGGDCLCGEVLPLVVSPVAFAGGASLAMAAPARSAGLRVFAGATAECVAEHPSAVRVSVDRLHWLTSGATSFARGLNDAPKIVALVLAASALTSNRPVAAAAGFAAVALGMTVGSLVGGYRVTSLLAERITPLDHMGGFFANLVTSTLVGLGALQGLPLSTTHVSAGAIMGSGSAKVTKGALWTPSVRSMLLAWVVTIPGAAVLGVAAFEALLLVSRMGRS